MPIGISPLSNANAPQPYDIRRAAGYALVAYVSLTAPTAGPGTEYQYGTHAAAIHNSQTQLSSLQRSVNSPESGQPLIRAMFTQPQSPEHRNSYLSKVPLATETVNYQPLRPYQAAPQSYDFTLQAFLQQPVTQQGYLSSQYTFGTHAYAIYNSQAGGQVIPTATATPPKQAYKAITAAPQVVDLTLQAFIPFVPVPTGFIMNLAAGSPQDYDWTLQAFFQPASPTPTIQGPMIPTATVMVPLQDPKQLMAQVYKPPGRVAAPVSPKALIPRQDNPTQIAAQVFKALPTPPAKWILPKLVSIPQQAYIDIPQPDISVPLVGSLPTFINLTGQALNFTTGTAIGALIQLVGIYDYFTLAQALQDFSHRTDIANFQDYYIQQGETRIYRDLFAENIGNGVKWIEQPLTGLTTANAPIPTGYYALKAMQVTDGYGNVFTLLYKDPQWMYANYPIRSPTQLPSYVARDGSNFVFGPYPDAAYTISGTYYGASTPISATNPTTWMTTYCPDLLLAACMLEMQPFLKDSAALKTWKALYTQKLKALVDLDQSERVAAGVLSIEVE